MKSNSHMSIKLVFRSRARPETAQTRRARNKIMNKSHYKWRDGRDNAAVRVNALFYVN